MDTTTKVPIFSIHELISKPNLVEEAYDEFRGFYGGYRKAFFCGIDRPSDEEFNAKMPTMAEFKRALILYWLAPPGPNVRPPASWAPGPDSDDLLDGTALDFLRGILLHVKGLEIGRPFIVEVGDEDEEAEDDAHSPHFESYCRALGDLCKQ